MWRTKSGNRFTGSGSCTSASGPSSSSLFIQDATVAAVTRKALAVCSKDQPRGLQFQDGHAFDGREEWPAVWRNRLHAGVLDAFCSFRRASSAFNRSTSAFSLMRAFGLSAAQPWVWAMLNWATLITCKMADLTREGQSRGNGIAGNTDLAGMARLQETLRGRLLEAYLKRPQFHGLEPNRRGPKIGGPTHHIGGKNVL